MNRLDLLIEWIIIQKKREIEYGKHKMFHNQNSCKICQRLLKEIKELEILKETKYAI